MLIWIHAQCHHYTATTLDGYIADPTDSLDCLLRQPQDSSGALNYAEFFAGVGAIVMGSTSYAWLLDNFHIEEFGGRWPCGVPSWVMTTRSLPVPDGADVQFTSGAIGSVYEEMRSAAWNLWVLGGGDPAGQFADPGLLDEVITYTAPVVLGAGQPLLPRRLDFELVETYRNGSFVASWYRILGPLAEDRHDGAKPPSCEQLSAMKARSAAGDVFEVMSCRARTRHMYDGTRRDGRMS